MGGYTGERKRKRKTKEYHCRASTPISLFDRWGNSDTERPERLSALLEVMWIQTQDQHLRLLILVQFASHFIIKEKRDECRNTQWSRCILSQIKGSGIYHLGSCKCKFCRILCWGIWLFEKVIKMSFEQIKCMSSEYCTFWKMTSLTEERRKLHGAKKPSVVTGNYVNEWCQTSNAVNAYHVF